MNDSLLMESDVFIAFSSLRSLRDELLWSVNVSVANRGSVQRSGFVSRSEAYAWAQETEAHLRSMVAA